MKKKKVSVIVPILWVFVTVMWTVTFICNLEYYGLSDPLVILQGATVVVSLAAAIVNFIRYKKQNTITKINQLCKMS
ncbi:MAG: hypothetical protein VB078_10020 [Clostridiaceae bacterium]|nr:hypothetical protein [Clostridiaceae bacterium]